MRFVDAGRSGRGGGRRFKFCPAATEIAPRHRWQLTSRCIAGRCGAALSIDLDEGSQEGRTIDAAWASAVANCDGVWIGAWRSARVRSFGSQSEIGAFGGDSDNMNHPHLCHAAHGQRLPAAGARVHAIYLLSLCVVSPPSVVGTVREVASSVSGIRLE